MQHCRDYFPTLHFQVDDKVCSVCFFDFCVRFCLTNASQERTHGTKLCTILRVLLKLTNLFDLIIWLPHLHTTSIGLWWLSKFATSLRWVLPSVKPDVEVMLTLHSCALPCLVVASKNQKWCIEQMLLDLRRRSKIPKNRTKVYTFINQINYHKLYINYF